MSKRQRTAMLHLARCASYLTKDHPLDAAVAHRRGDLVRAAFIGYGQRHEIESAKFTRSNVSADIKLPQFRRFCSREGRSWADDGHTKPSARLPASGARLLFELGLRGQQPIVYPPVPSAGTRAMEHTTCLASGQIHPISECSLSAAWPSPLGFPSRTSRASSRAAEERGAGCRSLAS